MKVLYSIFIGLSLMLIMSSSSIADYEVNGAGASAVNGLYEDYGTYDTYKSDGLYSNQAMPVHRKWALIIIWVIEAVAQNGSYWNYRMVQQVPIL